MEGINEDLSEAYLQPRKIKNCNHFVQVTAIKFENQKRMTSSNQTGVFPITSVQGYRYVMVMKDSD